MHMHTHTLTFTFTCAHTLMCTHSQGNYFERTSVLSGLLSVTTVIDRLNPLHLRDERYSCFTGLRNFPNISSVDALNCLVSVCVCVCRGGAGISKVVRPLQIKDHLCIGAGGLQQAMCSSKNYL